MGNLVDAVRSLENSMRSKSAAYEAIYWYLKIESTKI